MDDTDLIDLLRRDPHRGWSLFIAHYTPTVMALIRRSGLSTHDEIMDVYVRVCERLSESQCSRLSAYNPARGPLSAWLATVVRRVAVDWVRTRTGRRRHFHSVLRLPAFERSLFELRYWKRHDVPESHGLLETRLGRTVSARELDEALMRVEQALTRRHRMQLATTASRSASTVALNAAGALPFHFADPRPDPERRLLARESAAFLRRWQRRRRGNRANNALFAGVERSC